MIEQLTLDVILTGATNPCQNGTGSNGTGGILHIPPAPRL